MATGRRLVLSGCTVDLATRHVFRASGERLRLTPKEAGLLAHLADSPDEVVSRRTLLTEVWDYAPSVESRAVDVAVRTLRKKIEDDPKNPVHVVSVYGEGYRFVAPVQRSASMAPARRVRPPSAAPSAGRLPVSGARLIGRDDLIEQSAEVLRSVGLMSLWGPPGIGKSALALKLAQHWSGGSEAARVTWVDLGGVSSHAALTQHIGAALGVAEKHRAHLEAVLAASHGALLVLDQADELDRESAATLVRWAAHPEAVRMLVTRRERLWVESEHAVLVPPLSRPASVQLLSDAATAADRRGLRIRADDPGLTRIAEMLDGIPLALRIAAGRLPYLGIKGLERALHDPFAVLADPEHGRLRGILDRAWIQLPPGHRRLLSQLSLWQGAFDLADADAAAGRSAVELVIALVDQGWLRPWPGRAGVFHLLRPLRALAESHLAEEERPAVRARISGRIAERLEEASEDEPAGHIRLDEALDAVRWSALAQPDLACRIALALVDRSKATGPWSQVLEAVKLAQTGQLSTQLRDRLRVSEARMLMAMGRAEEAIALVEALPASTDPRDRATACVVKGGSLYQQREFDAAIATYELGFSLAMQVGDRVLQSRNAYGRGVMLRVSGRWEQARAPLEQARSLARDGGSAAAWRTATLALAELCLDQGRVQEAETLAAQALAATHPDRTDEVAQACFVLAAVHAGQGDVQATQDRLEEAFARFSELGAAFDAAVCVHNLALVHLERRDPARALQMLDLHETWRREVREALPPNMASSTRAIAHHLAGRRALARRMYDEVIADPHTPGMVALFARAMRLDLVDDEELAEADLGLLRDRAEAVPGGTGILAIAEGIRARRVGGALDQTAETAAWKQNLDAAPARLRPALRLARVVFGEA